MITTAMRRIFIENISEVMPGEVRLRGWVYRLRILGKTAFVILRDCSGEAQCVISSEALKAHRLKVEDVVEILGSVRAEPRSKSGCEVDISEVHVLNRAGQTLPFQIRGPGGLGWSGDAHPMPAAVPSNRRGGRHLSHAGCDPRRFSRCAQPPPVYRNRDVEDRLRRDR